MPLKTHTLEMVIISDPEMYSHLGAVRPKSPFRLGYDYEMAAPYDGYHVNESESLAPREDYQEGRRIGQKVASEASYLSLKGIDIFSVLTNAEKERVFHV